MKFDNLRINRCIEYKIDDDRYTLLPVDNRYERRYLLIDGISYEVYLMLKSGKTYSEIMEEMLAAYDVSREELENDLIQVLSQWIQYGVADAAVETKTESNTWEQNDVAESQLTDLEVYDVMYQSAMDNERPFKVFFEITHNCNLRCVHCYLQETVRKQENVFLDKNIILRCVDELKEMGAHEIVVTGGECTLHPDFMEIVKYICDKELKLVLLTNGNLINEHFIDDIMDYPIADIRISIYGTEQIHDDFTKVKGSFQRSLYALKELRRRKKIGTATVMVTKLNFDHMDELLDILRKNDIPNDFNTFIFPTTEHNMSPTYFRIENNVEEFVNKYVVNCSGSKCAAGIARFRVDPYGTVSPCDLLKHEHLGNLHEKSFRAIFESDKRKEWLEKLSNILKSNECSGCENKKFCNSCLGLIYMENRTYDRKMDFLCQFAEAKKQKLARISLRK